MTERKLLSSCRDGNAMTRETHSTPAARKTIAMVMAVTIRLWFVTNAPDTINVTITQSMKNLPASPACRKGKMTKTRIPSERETSVRPMSPDQNSLMCMCKTAVRDCCVLLAMRAPAGSVKRECAKL